MRRVLITTACLAAMLAAAPGSALACPVCFGANDSPMAIATNMGIVAMLVVVVGVLGAFATFFIYLMRRAKMVASQSDPVGAGHVDGGGTAQC
jgi:ABC-type thiamin/hydroxymethylpyrimidine transport system permease subunit